MKDLQGATETAIERIIADLDFGIKIFTQLKKEIKKKQKLIAANNNQEDIMGGLNPGTDYIDIILMDRNPVPTAQIGRDYGMNGQTMNDLLYQLEVQNKQNGRWVLADEFQGKGYTQPDKMDTRWTQKGRLFLYNLLKDCSILPLIERGEINVEF